MTSQYDLNFKFSNTEIVLFYNRSSAKPPSKKPIIILSVLLGIFIISTIVLAALFTHEKIVNSVDGIDFILYFFI